jgi:RHS repeat-associated protein
MNSFRKVMLRVIGGLLSLAMSFAISCPRDAAAQTPSTEIVELARALKNSPDLIFEYVYNNIDTLPQYGSLKGPLGTLLDGKGTAFDQAELMVALLQQAGYSAAFVVGQIERSAGDLTNWLGTDTSLGGAKFTLGSGGFPATMLESGGVLTGARFGWAWVQVNIGGTSYVFDPSTKVYARSNGLTPAAMATALGYDKPTFISRALSGSSTTLASITGVNRSNIRSDLTDHSTKLAGYVRANNFAAATTDIIGGTSITPLSVGTQHRDTALPYQYGSATIYSSIPSALRTTLKLELGSVDTSNNFTVLTCAGSAACAVTFNSSAIYGHRLVVSFDSSAVPSLLMDGVTQLAATTAVPGGRQLTVRTSIVHPYPTTANDVTNNLSIRVTPALNAVYLLATGWGRSGRGMIEKHRRLLQENIAQDPNNPAAEPVLGESLAVLGYTWLAELSQTHLLVDQLAGTTTAYHHAVGVVGMKAVGASTGPFVDLPLNIFSVVQRSQPDSGAITPTESAAFFCEMTFFSIAESGVLEQTQPGAVAVSTVKLIDTAVQAGGQIFDINNSATPGNNYSYYLSNIRPTLASSYGSADLSRIDALVSPTPSGQNLRVIAPANGAISVDQYTGAGYFRIDQAGTEIGAIITGGLNGGLPATPVTIAEVIQNTPFTVVPAWMQTFEISIPSLSSMGNAGGLFGFTPTSQEPINLVTGDYLLNTTDLAVGSLDMPYGLSFQRYYDSGTRQQDGPLGFGWTHSFAITASVNSDAFEGMAINSPVSGAVAIAATFITLDILNDGVTTNKPLDRMVIASVVQRWLMDQLKDNIVAVAQPGAVQHFVKLADGTYNAPLGIGAQLALQDGAYVYSAKDRSVLSFDKAGNLVTWSTPAGTTISLGYSGSPARLTSVTNNLGRSLAFSYADGKLSQVTDDSGRSVSYAYDSAGSLSGFTDPLGNTTVHVYAQPGQLTQIFYPGAASAFVTNTYDPLGRVRTQTNANGATWEYFFAGRRTEEVDPLGMQHVLYMTPRGRTRLDIQDYSGLRLVTSSVLDGLDRLISTTLPEGGSTAYTYDTTVNAWANNIASVVRNPKPGPSPPSPLVTSYVYEPTFNKPTKVTDPRGITALLAYDPSTGNLLSTVADAATLKATTRSTYNTVGLVASVTDPVGTVTRHDYDTFGNRISTTADAGPGGLNLATAYGYNARGDVVSVTDPRGAVATNSYDAARQLLATTLPGATPGAAGMVTTNTWDPQGRLLQVQQSADGSLLRTTSTTYTPTGKPSTTTDANGNVTRFTYDLLDRRGSITDAMGRVTRFTYTALSQPFRTYNTAISANPLLEQSYTDDGLPASLKDANGNTTGFGYDRFDRLATMTYPLGSTETFTYDGNGNVLTRKTRAGDTIAFAYDGLNRPTSKTPPSGPAVTYTYDLAGRVKSVSDNSAGIPSVAMPPSTTTYAASYVYDALNRPTGASWDPAPAATAPTAGPLVTFTHAYNKANQRVGQTVDDNTWLSYPAGVRTTKYEPPLPNELNQYTTIATTGQPTIIPTYDGNGNLASDGTYTLGYDVENRLVSASGAGNTASYAFDGQGRRKSRTVNGTTTISVTDADNREVLEYDGNTGAVLRWYAFGLGPNAVLNQMNVPAGTRASPLADLLGSIIGSFDSSTGALTKFSYQPYGSSSAAATPFGFTGQRFDAESGLYYYRARHYSTALGRFLQPDPIGYDGGVLLYAYVGNDPLNLVDSAGLNAESSGGSSLSQQGSGRSFWSFVEPVAGLEAGAIGTAARSALLGAATAAGAFATVLLYPSTPSALDTCATGGCERVMQYVVRGGQSTAEQFRTGTGVTIDANGLLHGVSVQTFPNKSIQELSQRQWVPHNTMGVSNVAAINSANGYVVPDPTRTNPYHATMGGITPEMAERLFNPTIRNPNPRIR